MSERESELDRVSRTLKGKKAIAKAPDIAREFAAAQWLSDDETARLCVVIEEWIANLFDHGGLGTKDVIDLTIDSDDDGIRVRITDRGNPFDPRHLPLDLGDPSQNSGAGAGIGLMRSWAELESYDVGPEGNRLTFLLPLHWSS